MKFADGNSTINERLMLEEEIVKEFTIENTGDLDAEINIEWLDLINTYMLGSLTYTLEQSEEKITGYEEILSKTEVPVSNTEYSYTLIPDLQIPVGKTYYYRLRIKLNDLEVEQNEDINAILSTKFNATPVSSDKKYTLEIDLGGGMIGEEYEIPKMHLKEGETYSTLIPTKLGEEFIGWIVSGYGSSLVENKLTIGKSNTKLIAKWKYSPSNKTLNQLGLTFKNSIPNFRNLATTDEGIFAMEDDYGISYYFRGTVTNKYVKFANFYWRILRINGNGSLRVVYDGTSAHPNGEASLDRVAIQNVVYNSKINDAKYVGYMYGPAGDAYSTSIEEAQSNIEDSTIKIALDKWYEDNILANNFQNNISDSLFCNDRSKEIESHLGYGSSNTYYGGRGRYRGTWSGQPTLKCPQKNDAFTVSDIKNGNGSLKYPVGIITKDEDLVAGTGSSKNQKYFLYKGYKYWTMTPDSYYSSKPQIMPANSWDSYISSSSLYVHIVPVINLNIEFIETLIGTGTMEDPFREKGIEP